MTSFIIALSRLEPAALLPTYIYVDRPSSAPDYSLLLCLLLELILLFLCRLGPIFLTCVPFILRQVGASTCLWILSYFAKNIQPLSSCMQFWICESLQQDVVSRHTEAISVFLFHTFQVFFPLNFFDSPFKTFPPIAPAVDTNKGLGSVPRIGKKNPYLSFSTT